MARYRLEEAGVLDQERGSHIPSTTRNRDWRTYLEWVEEGNVADPIREPDPLNDEDKLNATDQMMIRTLDWLLHELVTNGVIRRNDIPPKLRALYLERKALRGA